MTQGLEELQREVEKSRAKLDVTLDRLEEKMTISGVVDDLLGSVKRGQMAPLYDRTIETLRSNPIPILLFAAGAALLLHRLRPPSRHPLSRSPRTALDEDLPQAPLEPRLYQTGATTLQSRDDDNRRGPATARI